MQAEERKVLLRRFWHEVWDRKDVRAAAGFLTEDVVLHVAGADLAGRALLEGALPSQWFDPFPDLEVRVDLQVAEDTLVSELLTFRGTHSGADFHPGLFRSRGLPPIPASGLSFEFTQTSICRFDGSRIAEIWEDFDRVRLFLQLGVELVVPT